MTWDAVPACLRDRPQWVLWRYEQRRGKLKKVPYGVHGHPINATAPEAWTTFEKARAEYARRGMDGIGFALAPDGGLTALDLDDCRDPGTGALADWAQAIITRLASYTEVSPSGRGLRIFVYGTLPVRRNRKGHIELYDRAHFVTVTGQHLDGTPADVLPRQAELDALCAELFPPPRALASRAAPPPVALDDAALLERARRAVNGAAFDRLWRGDTTGYPSHSEADLALCAHLAFWTGRDAAWIDRLFRQSGLYRPEKWDAPHYSDGRTYGEATIAQAIQSAGARYVLPPTAPATPTPVNAEELLPPLPADQLWGYLAQDEWGDAQLLATLYRGRLVYDHAEQAWYYWAGHAWQRDTTTRVTQLVARQVAAQYWHLAEELAAEAADLPENSKERQAAEEDAKAAARRAQALRTLRRVQHVLGFAASLLGIPGTEWDADPWLLGCPNGVVDLRTGELRPGRPEDYIRTVVPTPWGVLDAPAPRWHQFLHEVLGEDAALVAFCQRLLGYGLTGLTIEHVLPVLWGPGRNGKDTLLETLGAVLGPLAGPVSADVLIGDQPRAGAAQPHLYALRGKRLVWASETNEGARLNAGLVKWATGGGTLKARPLYGNPVEFRPTHLLLLSTNYRPRAAADDYALWKRLLLVPFTRRFVDDPAPGEHRADPRLREKLLAEASGILAWLVRGCLAWQQQGLAPPPAVRQATAQYQRDEDTLAQFIEECCVLDPAAQTPATALYQAYTAWAGRHPMSPQAFGRRLRERFEKRHTRAGEVYQGIGLLAPPPG